jgi:hypothetical protein
MAKAVVVAETEDKAVVEDEVIKQNMVMDVEKAVEQAMVMGEEAIKEVTNPVTLQEMADGVVYKQVYSKYCNNNLQQH